MLERLIKALETIACALHNIAEVAVKRALEEDEANGRSTS
jgi:hypothetical protein